MNFKQQGLSIVELLIASALGIVVSLFIMNIMITSASTSTTSEGISQSQETARLVSAWLQEEVRRGGFQYEMDVFAPIAAVCAGGVAPPAAGANCSFETDDNGTGGDRLAIQRKAYNDAGSPARDSQTCAGAAIPAAVIASANPIVTDVFWIEPNTGDSDPINDYSFRCVTYDNAGNVIDSAQTIANGVESLQVLYGLASDTDQMTRFVPLDDLSPLDFERVTAVRIGLLARSFEDGAFDDAARAYLLLDSNPVQYNDSFSRFVQVSTVWFPNTEQ